MMKRTNDDLGIAGRIARFFLQSRLTALIAILTLLLGAFAIVVTPREEEPQINVTMANVLVPFPGASARDVETLVAIPAEQVIAQIAGLEHVYSVSRPGHGGHHRAIQGRRSAHRSAGSTLRHDRIPTATGCRRLQNVGAPVIKPKGIDDVPIVTLTLWTKDEARGAFDLERVAHAVEAELKRVPGTREVVTIGGPGRAVRVLLDPRRGSRHSDLAPADIRQALVAANVSLPAGDITCRQSDRSPSTAGAFFADRRRRRRAGRRCAAAAIPFTCPTWPTIVDGAPTPARYAWIGAGPARRGRRR